jgi:hypothetical protein
MKKKKELKPLHNDEPMTTHTQLIEILYEGDQRSISVLTLNEVSKREYGSRNGIAHMTQRNAQTFLERLKQGDFDLR